MLTIAQRLRKNKSHKAFLKLENELLTALRQEGLLKGNYGSTFNELSYRISNVIELISLQYVDDRKEAELLRSFSQNPDLFHYAASKGMHTSTYLAYEGKGEEAQKRILGKIQTFLLEDIRNNTLFQHSFAQIESGIAGILLIRYPKYFLDPESIKASLKMYRA